MLGCREKLREGEDGTRPLSGYSFIVKESWGRTSAITYQGVSEDCVVFDKATRRVERDAVFFFLQTTGPISGLLVGVPGVSSA